MIEAQGRPQVLDLVQVEVRRLWWEWKVAAESQTLYVQSETSIAEYQSLQESACSSYEVDGANLGYRKAS